MKKVTRNIIIVIISLFLFPIFLVCGNMAKNNLDLFWYSHNLYKYPLPPQTTLIEKGSKCGLLWGNGDDMDFMSYILVKSDLTLEQIKCGAVKKNGTEVPLL